METYREPSREEGIENDLIRRLGWSWEQADRERIVARQEGYRSFREYLEVKLREKTRREEEEEARRRRQLNRPRRSQAQRPPGSGMGFGELLSPCHNATIGASLGDGVLIGSCSVCHKNVVRINPRTHVEEWLDGNSPWSKLDLRPVKRD